MFRPRKSKRNAKRNAGASLRFGTRMGEITKTIRALDSDAYRTFRAKAVELGYTTGQALNEAMRMWLNAKNRPKMTMRAEVGATAEAESPA